MMLIRTRTTHYSWSQLMCSHVYLVYGRVTRVCLLSDSSARPRASPVARRGRRGSRARGRHSPPKAKPASKSTTRRRQIHAEREGSRAKELSAFYRRQSAHPNNREYSTSTVATCVLQEEEPLHTRQRKEHSGSIYARPSS